MSFINYASKSQTKDSTQDILDNCPTFQRPKDLIYEFIYFQAKYTVSKYLMSEQMTIPYIHYEAVVTEEMENKNKNNITRM